MASSPSVSPMGDHAFVPPRECPAAKSRETPEAMRSMTAVLIIQSSCVGLAADGLCRRVAGALDVHGLQDLLHPGMSAGDRLEGRLVELQQHAGRGRGDGGRARAAGEGRDLAEERALAEPAQGHVVSGGVADEHLHLSGGNDEDALPRTGEGLHPRSEEHTSELQSLTNIVCRLLLEKKINTK